MNKNIIKLVTATLLFTVMVAYLITACQSTVKDKSVEIAPRPTCVIPTPPRH